MKKLIAIDGNSLLYRSFYALPPMSTADGTPTGALHGFMSMLLKLTAMQPDYLLVAFDMHGPTFRHESYEAYKAGRKETPDDLRKQLPILKELLIEMGIAVCECPRYEADDILGTFSRRCGQEGVFALLVTGDRDALQLVNENTHVLMTKKGLSETVEYDEATLMDAYGLAPDHMRDLKGLMGDNSDNIPGIPGVGEKTALKLLNTYGDICGVLAHAEEIPGKLGERIRENRASAEMSYALGTIDTNAPVEKQLSECAFREGSLGGARTHLLKLEMRSLAARLPEGSAEAITAAAATSAQMIPLDDESALSEALEPLLSAESLAVTLEGGLSFAFDGACAYTLAGEVDLFHPAPDDQLFWKLAGTYLGDSSKKLLSFDGKALRHAAEKQGISVRCHIFDAMIADYLLNANRPAGALAALSMQRYETERTDAAVLYDLERDMLPALEQAGMTKLYQDMELPLSEVLFAMEQDGFLVDPAILESLQTQFALRVETLSAEIYALAGHEFNILSPKQLGDVLFVQLGLKGQKKTKTGYSTDADTLEALSGEHEIIPLVLEYRFIAKLKSTFIDGLLAVRSESDGRVRSRFNQCVTATGRISSTEPNLQNIPVRTELGREIRKAFIASPGNILVGADYSQIELRLLAHISGDAGMIDAFNSGKDIHSITASEVFGVPLDAVSGELRSAAKAVNFGIVYGISDFGLARNLGIPVKRAADYIRLYFARYPDVKAYLDTSVERAKANGYAVTLFGRRRALPELSSGNYNTRSFGERVAMNMPIQGTAADIIKTAMVNAASALRQKNLSAKLILQVHDELIFDTPLSEEDTVRALVKDCMENVMRLSVPLKAEVKSGHSWYDTK